MKCSWYSEKERKAWCRMLKKIEKLEAEHHKLPRIEVGDSGALPNLMMERTTCMAKEIAKLVCSCSIKYLPGNTHILEEIGLLKQDMEILDDELMRWRLKNE